MASCLTSRCRLIERREYVLQFSDGHAWATTSDPSDATDDQIRGFVRAVSDRSGVPITELPILERDEFLPCLSVQAEVPLPPLASSVQLMTLSMP